MASCPVISKIKILQGVLLGALLLLNAHVFAQCPPNIGFEDGSFKNWQCYAGNIDSTGVISMDIFGQIYNRHTINSKTYQSGVQDPFGHFPIVCPNNSNYSVRLGNSDTGHQAERLTYQFKVPAGSAYSLILNYAVVLENPPHAAYQQPKFTAQVFDVTDNKYIDCPSFNFIASADLPGFKLSDVMRNGSRNSATVYYKEWSPTTINLVGYAGKTVRLEFTTNDCTPGGHFGYAYFDIDEGCTPAITGNTYCAGQNAITLHAPPGFYDYFWYTGDMKTQVGHGETLLLDPAPDDKTKYALAIVPYPGLGCPDTLFTTINKLDASFKLQVADTVYGCGGDGADLTAPSVTAGSSNGMILSYFTDPVTLTYLYHPSSVGEGTYYIRGISPEGCENIVPVHVVINPKPIIAITDPPAVQYPRTIDLSSVFIPAANTTYSYFKDAVATIPITNYRAINVSGTYYIKGINNFGCETITYTKVTVTPPPGYNISAPNVFTPNNDGINDYFMVTIDGFVKFGSLKVFNRWGQLLYTAKSINELWNGNYNGHALPVGTYYWLFEGADQYSGRTITKAAAIVIQR